MDDWRVCLNFFSKPCFFDIQTLQSAKFAWINFQTFLVQILVNNYINHKLYHIYECFPWYECFPSRALCRSSSWAPRTSFRPRETLRLNTSENIRSDYTSSWKRLTEVHRWPFLPSSRRRQRGWMAHKVSRLIEFDLMMELEGTIRDEWTRLAPLSVQAPWLIQYNMEAKQSPLEQ